MRIKHCKTIAEYAITRWLAEQNFALENFKLEMNGNEGTLTDRAGDSLTLVYDAASKSVYIKED